MTVAPKTVETKLRVVVNKTGVAAINFVVAVAYSLAGSCAFMVTIVVTLVCSVASRSLLD